MKFKPIGNKVSFTQRTKAVNAFLKFYENSTPPRCMYLCIDEGEPFYCCIKDLYTYCNGYDVACREYAETYQKQIDPEKHRKNL